MLTFLYILLIFYRVNWSAHEKHLLTHYQKKLHERPFHTKSFQTLHATAPVTHFPRTVTLFSGFNPERTQNLKIFNNSPTHSVKFGILHVRTVVKLHMLFCFCCFVVFYSPYFRNCMFLSAPPWDDYYLFNVIYLSLPYVCTWQSTLLFVSHLSISLPLLGGVS